MADSSAAFWMLNRLRVFLTSETSQMKAVTPVMVPSDWMIGLQKNS
ncbi:MAG: hypothetical protein R3E97_13105 [Candidatus Eisenbacteria bacterium]